MIIQGLEQNTPDWLPWRKKHVCASEIGVLMGESDFSTPLKIWEIKTGRGKEQESNPAMQRGSDNESKIRALYSLENDIDVPPVVVEHDLFPFFSASLDGYNEEQSLVVEIKYPGREKHQMAIEGKIPECYYGQVQFQLDCSGAKYCDYVSFNGVDIAVVRVERDQEYIDRMIPVAIQFWEYVKRDQAPPLTDRDFKILEDEQSVSLAKEWRDLYLFNLAVEEEYAKLKKQKDEAKFRLEVAREKILGLDKHPKILCGGVQILIVQRKSGPTLSISVKE